VPLLGCDRMVMPTLTDASDTVLTLMRTRRIWSSYRNTVCDSQLGQILSLPELRDPDKKDASGLM